MKHLNLTHLLLASLIFTAAAAAVLVPAPAHAATCTVVAGGGNWSSTGTWSCGAVPTSADAVAAGASSGNLTVDTAGSAASLDFTGYTGTLTMTSSLTASGNVTLSNAMTISGTGGLTVNATATLTSNGKVWPNDLTLGSAASMTFTLADDLTVAGSLDISCQAGSTVTINGNHLYVGKNLTPQYFQSNHYVTVNGTTTIILNGTGTWSQSNGLSVIKNPLTINTSGTITISGTVGYNTGTLTYTAGTVVTTGSTFVIGASTTLPIGITWANLKFDTNSSMTVTLSANTTVAGNLTLLSMGGTTTTVNGYALYVGGDLTLGPHDGNPGNCANVNGTTSIVLNGTSTWSSQSNCGGLTNALTINTLGTITVSGAVYYNTGALVYTAGTVITTGSTLVIGNNTTLPSGVTWNNLQIGSGSSMTVALSTNTTITGSLTLLAQTATITLNGYNLYVEGNIALNPSDGNPGNCVTVNGTTSIVLNGTGTWSSQSVCGALQLPLTINTTGTITLGSTVYYNTGTLTVAAGTLDLAGNSTTATSGTFVVDSGATLKLKGNETVPTFTFNSGGNATYYGTSSYSSLPLNAYSNLTFNGAGGTWTLNHALTVANNLTLTAGTLDTSTAGCSSASCAITVAGTFNHAGGTFTPNTGTVTLNGTNQEIEGSTTFYNLSKIATGADSLTFVSSSTTTIAPGGTLTLKGANATSLLTLQSSSPGTQWNLNVPNTATANATTLQYLAIQDSDASQGSPIDVTGGHDQDQGNNKYWVTEELPSNLSATSSPTNNDQIDLTWSPNQNFTNTQWYAETTDASHTTGYLTYPVQSYSFTGLACHTAYTFHIKSRNGTATTESAYTTAVTATTGACSSGFAGSTAPAASSSQNTEIQNPKSQTNPNDQTSNSQAPNSQTPTPTTTPPPSDTGSDLISQILAKIAQLRQEIAAMQSEQGQAPQFTKDLRFGDTDPQVKLLQQWLNNHGYPVNPSTGGPGSPGHETDLYGYATMAAVAKLQQDRAADILLPAGLTQSTGIFGPATRRWVVGH